MLIAELWRYPVKSMGGERLRAAEVDELGVRWDRRWGLVDVASGRVLTAKRDGRLMAARARMEGDSVAITLPDGTETLDNAVLSDWLGRSVELRAAGEEGGHFENPRDYEAEADWVYWQGPGRAWHDIRRARVSLVSIETLGEWDVRRFRPNVLLTGGGEQDLVGREVKLGSAVLSIEKELERCVMVTREQPGLPRDLGVLREINSKLRGILAVGALVRSGGVLGVGDELLEA